MDEKALRKLREKLDKLLAANRNDEAVVLLAELVRAEPTNARWTHKRGDLLRRLGRNPEAVEAYTQAVDIYASAGFIARAVAMAKTVLSLDPTRVDVLSRVDPNAAQQLHRQARPGAVSVRPAAPRSAAGSQGSQRRHAAIMADDEPPPTAAAGRHPMLLEDDGPPAPAPAKGRHPMVLEDDAPAPTPGRHPMVLEDDAPAPAPVRHPMVLEDDAASPTPVVLDEPAPAAPAPQPLAAARVAPPKAATAAKPRVPPPPASPRPGPAAASGSNATRARPAPPPPPAASQSKRLVTLDQLSLPPPVPPPPPPPAKSAFAVRGSEASPAPVPRPAPAAEPRPVAPQARPSDAPLWAERSPAGRLPQREPPARAPSAPIRARYEPPADEAELFSRALEAAIDLSVAPDAAPNETRFSNAPPSAALALSEAEVSPRTAAATDADQDALQPSADQLSNLPLFPLFAEVPPEVLSEMITGSELIELADADYVMRKGDPGDALYGIIEGSVVVNVPGQPVEHTLAEGDVFGESCLLQDEPRHADARVKGRLTALRIPRDTLLRMLRGHPPLAELLLELLTRRLLGNLLQSSPLFQEFDAEGRRTLSRMFEVRRAATGTRLAIAGKRMDGLYISLTGTLLVEPPGGEPRIAAPGSMFGQHTLLSQEPAPASITARVNLVVLRLPSATFSQLAMQYPTIVARLAELSTDEVVSVTL
jgi:CRP-like cAMP-binding protein